jgi:NADH pyrophosphatase NudC (nudix superfamily)
MVGALSVTSGARRSRSCADHPLVADTADSAGAAGWHGDGAALVETACDAAAAAGTVFEELRPLLAPSEAGLLPTPAPCRSGATAMRLCGAPTQPVSAGHVMRCSNERWRSFFPRIDPAIIGW